LTKHHSRRLLCSEGHNIADPACLKETYAGHQAVGIVTQFVQLTEDSR